MKQTKQELRLAYEVACTNYLAAFMEQYDLSCDPHPWVADEVGTVALVGDDYFNMEEIRFCVDKEIPWDEVSEWQDYNEEASCIGLDLINLKSWNIGYRGVPKERRDRIKSMRRELEELVEQTKQEANEGGLK